MVTSLEKLKDADACVDRYAHLRRALGKGFAMTSDLTLIRILELNGIDDALWALDNAVDGGGKICRLFAADCAEHVLHIFLKVRPNDSRPADAIKAARSYARGEIGAAAGAAAWDAAGAAAWAAARAAAWDAAGDAAWAAAGAAAWDAAWDAARAVEQRWQKERLIGYLNDETRTAA
jgi:hypothetical protein